MVTMQQIADRCGVSRGTVDRALHHKEGVREDVAERIRATAALWLETHETALQPRFDVVEVYAPDGMHTKAPEIRLIEDAF